MEKSGHKVIQAWDGRQGIESALKDRPDLILLDIQLPDMDGYAVARELRTHVTLDRIPIVAVTSYAMVGDRERALRAGCRGYIEKPINPETFVDEIKKYLTPAKSDKGGG